MKLEDQVCSLELAKRLKELGVKQSSYFYYGTLEIPCLDRIHKNHIFSQIEWQLDEDSHYHIEYSAFTVAELGEMLPNNIQIKNNAPFDCYRLYITKFNSVDESGKIENNFIVNYECDSTECSGDNAWLRRKLPISIYDPNLANAFAKMLIHLIEKDMIEVKSG